MRYGKIEIYLIRKWGCLLKRILHFKAFIIPAIYFVVMAEIATWNSPELFSRVHHTFSVLGAQAFDQAWLMNTCWIGFGVLVLIITSMYHQKEDLPLAITYPIIAFAISVILIGIWRSDSGLVQASTDIDEAKDHLIFYTIGLGSIILGIILHALMSQSKKMKYMHLMFGILMVILMTLLYATSHYQGLFDRLLWAVILVWLSSMFGRMETHGNLS